MLIRVRVIALLLVTALAVSTGDPLVDCANEMNRCGSDVVAVVRKAAEGFALNVFDKSVLKTLCQDLEELAACFESSSPDICPASMVEAYKNNLMLIASSCDYLTCTLKIKDCGSDIASKFRIGMASDAVRYISIEGAGFNDVCNGIEDLKTCIYNAGPECPTTLIDGFTAQLDAIKPVCDVMPCSMEISECFGSYNDLLATPTYGIEMLNKVCGHATTIRDCLGTLTECPENTSKMYTDVMDTSIDMCTMIDDCVKSVAECAGETAQRFFHAVSKGKFDVATLENICPASDNLTSCLENSDTCPANITAQYKAMFANYISKGCEFIPCSKRLEACVGDVGNMKIDMNDGGYSISKVDELCMDEQSIVNCIHETSDECPSSFVAQLQGAVQAVMNTGCQINRCVKKVESCSAEMYEIIMNSTNMKPLDGMDNFCAERTAMETCFDDVREQCESGYISNRVDNLKMALKGCDFMGCVREVESCSTDMFNILMSSANVNLLDGLEDFCNKKPAMHTCLDDVKEMCGSTYIDNRVENLNMTLVGCEYTGCLRKVESCSVEIEQIFLESTDYANMGGLTKLCDNETSIRECFDGIKYTCDTGYVIDRVEELKVVLKGCDYIECVENVQVCHGEVGDIFLKGTDYGVGGLEQICEHKTDILDCFDELRGECPSAYVDSQIMALKTSMMGCDFIPCAKEVQECGLVVVKDVDITKLNLDTLVTFCENVMEVKTCFDKIGSECDQMVKDQWKGPIQMSYDRCVDIVQRYKIVIRPSTGGKNVAIVLKLQMTWESKYLNIDNEETKPFVAELKASLTKVYENTPGFKEVHIVRLFKSSVGVDHVVEYEQELSDRAITAVAAALTEALEENDDSLTVGSTDFKAAETPEMLFGEDTVSLDDLCEVYTKDNKCLNGGYCGVSGSVASCRCNGGFIGDHCERSGQGMVLPTISAIFASIGAILLIGAY